MDFLGIGVPELLFITLILLLVLGPAELVSLGRKSGQVIRRIRNSDTWRMVSNLAQALRNLPGALADETRAEEIFGSVVPNKDRRTIAPPQDGEGNPRKPVEPRPRQEGYSAWVTPPTPGQSPADHAGNDHGPEDGGDPDSTDSGGP